MSVTLQHDALSSVETALEEIDYALTHDDDLPTLTERALEDAKAELEAARDSLMRSGGAWDDPLVPSELTVLREVVDEVKDLFDLGWEVRNSDIPRVLRERLQEKRH